MSNEAEMSQARIPLCAVGLGASFKRFFFSFGRPVEQRTSSTRWWRS